MINLEQLADGSVSDRNFQKLMSLVPDTGGRSLGVRWGSQAITFTASTNSATASVTHGLGRTPVVGFAQAYNSPTFGNIPTPNISSMTATAFNLNGEVKTAFTGSVTIFWVVFG